MVLAIDELANTFDKLNPYVGKFEVLPSKPTITANEVDFIFGFRHVEDNVRKEAANAIKETFAAIATKRNVDVEVKDYLEMTSTDFSDEVIELVEAGAKSYGYSHHRLYSPAGHDARILNDMVTTGMVFAPSIKGLSHCEEEHTDDKDIENVTNVLLYVVEQLANKQ